MQKTELHLSEELQQAWSGQDPFRVVNKLEGETYRQVANRRTFKFQLGPDSCFAKVHKGVSWREIIKNLVQLRLPVVSARNEWTALLRLNELGINTLTPVGFGKRGIFPSTIESFLITKDAGTASSLEDVCANWRSSPPAFSFKLRLLEKLAAISQAMHSNGICHRDYYICHFLLLEDQPPTLCLIDLHRALIRKKLRRRWIVKDIGSLYFSAMDAGLSRRDLFRFMKIYSSKSLRCTLHEDMAFWKAVKGRAMTLKSKHSQT
ncbi:MAG: lipopolysaccharide core heptose(I) kinase RfaP [Pseudohongiellaceae bacterium]